MTNKIEYAPVAQTDNSTATQNALAQPVAEATLNLKSKVFTVALLSAMVATTAFTIYDTAKNPEKAMIILSVVGGSLTSAMGVTAFKLYRALTKPEEPTPSAESVV